MNKREHIIDLLLNHKPDYERTKKYFFEHYELLRFLGEVNYFSLYGYFAQVEDKEEALAYFLLGACRIFNNSFNNAPDSENQAWGLVLPLIADIVPKVVEVKNYHISVQFEPVREVDHD